MESSRWATRLLAVEGGTRLLVRDFALARPALAKALAAHISRHDPPSRPLEPNLSRLGEF